MICGNLNPDERATVSLDWLWEDGAHTITFRVDPNNKIQETVKVNNERTDAIQGTGFVVAMTQDFYDAFRNNANMIGSKSPEDWVQWHMDDMNQKFAEAIYPASPDGCNFRARIDQLIIVPNRDAGWVAISEYADISQGNWLLDGNYAQHGWTVPDWGLLHEWGHQLGLIDYYNLDIDIVRSTRLGLTDANGQVLAIEYLFPEPAVMMHWHGANPFHELSAVALNHQIKENGQQTGYHIIAVFYDHHQIRCYSPNGEDIGGFGSYGSGAGQFNNPTDVALDSQGNIYITDTGNNRIQIFSPIGEFLMEFAHPSLVLPKRIAIDAQDRVYVTDEQSNRIFVFDNGILINTIQGGTYDKFGVISIRSDGLIAVSNLDNWRIVFYTPDGTIKGSILVPNPEKPCIIHALQFKDNGDFIALADLYGGNFFTICAAPENFRSTIAGNALRLEWDEVMFADFYRLKYSATGIDGSWSVVSSAGSIDTNSFIINNAVTGYYRVGALGLDGSYFYSSVLSHNAVDFLVVTADRESLNEGVNDGIVFTVTRTGDLFEPLVVDLVSNCPDSLAIPQQLVIPAGKNSATFSGSGIQDYATNGDTAVIVTVVASGYNLGSCQVTVNDVPIVPVPLDADDKTLFYLNGNGTLQTHNGTAPVASSGVTFVDGLIDQGIHVGPQGFVQYQAENNVNSKEGTIEFWYKPDYDTKVSNVHRNFITIGSMYDHRNAMEISIDGAHNLVSYFNDGTNVAGAGTSANDFVAEEWYYLAVVWNENGVQLYVNGILKSITFRNPSLEKFGYDTPATITIGGYFNGNHGISGTIDEFRISTFARSEFEIKGVAAILGGGFVNFGKSGGFIKRPEVIPTFGLQQRS